MANHNQHRRLCVSNPTARFLEMWERSAPRVRIGKANKANVPDLVAPECVLDVGD